MKGLSCEERPSRVVEQRLGLPEGRTPPLIRKWELNDLKGEKTPKFETSGNRKMVTAPLFQK